MPRSFGIGLTGGGGHLDVGRTARWTLVQHEAVAHGLQRETRQAGVLENGSTRF